MKKYFVIELRGEAILELDQAVIDAVDDDWREHLYNLQTPEDIAEMIGRCMMLGARLTHLDGWADQQDNNARLVDGPEWETISVEELKK